MSDRPASELLRALGEATAGDPALSYDANAQASLNATLALRNALPQIIAVVEAAEELPEFFHTEDGWKHSFVPLLDALNEALS